MNTKFVSVVSLLIGLGIGLSLGSRQKTPPADTLEKMSTMSPQTSMAPREDATQIDPSSWRNRLDEIRDQMVERYSSDGNHRLIALLSQVPVGDLPELVRILSVELQQSRGTDALQFIYSRWAETDPQAAVASAEAIPNKSVRLRAMRAVFDGWALFDPGEVCRKLRAMPRGESRQELAETVIYRLAAHNPAAALSLLEREEYADEVDGFFRIWARRDSAAAMAAARTAT